MVKNDNFAVKNFLNAQNHEELFSIKIIFLFITKINIKWGEWPKILIFPSKMSENVYNHKSVLIPK